MVGCSPSKIHVGLQVCSPLLPPSKPHPLSDLWIKVIMAWLCPHFFGVVRIDFQALLRSLSCWWKSIMSLMSNTNSQRQQRSNGRVFLWSWLHVYRCVQILTSTGTDAVTVLRLLQKHWNAKQKVIRWPYPAPSGTEQPQQNNPPTDKHSLTDIQQVTQWPQLPPLCHLYRSPDTEESWQTLYAVAAFQVKGLHLLTLQSIFWEDYCELLRDVLLSVQI